MLSILYKIFSNELNAINQEINNLLICEETLFNEIIKYLSVNSGKKIRSLLLLIVSKAYKYEGNNHILYASIIELIHLAGLLHDDVIDQGTMRRSQYCTHLIWGNKSSILIGDFLFIKAFQLLIESEHSQIANILIQTSTSMSIGAIKELQYRHNIITQVTYHNIIVDKTAKLFGASCKIGAIISNCSNKITDDLYKFGLLLGIIFQITDDALDYNINSITKIQKEYGNDFLEGNVTLPIILLFNELDNKNRYKLQQIFYSTCKNKEDFIFITNLLLTHNIYQKIQNILDEYYQQASSILTSFIKIASPHSEYLKMILHYCFNRWNARL